MPNPTIETFTVGNETYDLKDKFAPTTAGIAGQVLISSGLGAPVWGNAPESLGKRVSSTVDDDSVSFIDSAIGNTSIIDGPYIQDVLVGVVDAEQSSTTVTFTLSDDSADGKTAYIWVRSV